MSSTRIAKPGTPPRQERYASSYQTGLLANLVAKRCAQIEDASECAPIWFLQWLSWQPGGLAAHINELSSPRDLEFNLTEDKERELFETCLSAEFAPQCDPDWKLAAAYRKRWIQRHAGGVQTTVDRLMSEAFDYARETRSLVLVEGLPRIGKSFTAREYIKRSAGLARLVNVPSSNDDQSFFREIAKALGVSSSLKVKAVEMRARIEEAISGGDLMLIFDESHYAFPQHLRGYSMPSRISWIMTALVNQGIPVAMIVTPQWHQAQARTEKLTGWTSEQWTGRIGFTQRLPEVLPIRDLLSVARSIFPEGNEKTWLALAGYSGAHPESKLGGMDALAKRARWFAARDGRQDATPEDLRNALRECCPLAALSPARRDTAALATRTRGRIDFTKMDAPASDLVT